MLPSELKEFIREHIHDDPALLCLNAKKEDKMDIQFAAEQIAIRQQLHNKLPLWSNNFELVFPSKLAGEQCSSELTAEYKKRFVSGGTLADLTGGLGVDLFYMSRNAEKAVYIERSEDYCEIAGKNFKVLQAANVEVIQGDSIGFLSDQTCKFDLIYVDPARRGDHNKRVYALGDCEPNVIKFRTLLSERAGKTLIKVSPMADLKQLLLLLPGTGEIHILSVYNECKEVLLLLGGVQERKATDIYCVNLTADKKEEFVFTLSEEEDSTPFYGDPLTYLYEPNAAILKGGAFKVVSARYGIRKLHKHSHLYTSDVFLPDFPGRIFSIEEIIPFSGKYKKELGKVLPKANITCRNFPLSVAQLRAQTKIKEGGDIYLFATTLADEKRVIIKTKKVEL
ncbi:MAG: RsmD family RNA methyltransferase [Bacteroidales bacterium]|nr:RsmD family RNA methyltransferase [Bacteroidales bacterium]